LHTSQKEHDDQPIHESSRISTIPKARKNHRQRRVNNERLSLNGEESDWSVQQNYEDSRLEETISNTRSDYSIISETVDSSLTNFTHVSETVWTSQCDYTHVSETTAGSRNDCTHATENKRRKLSIPSSWANKQLNPLSLRQTYKAVRNASNEGEIQSNFLQVKLVFCCSLKSFLLQSFKSKSN